MQVLGMLLHICLVNCRVILTHETKQTKNIYYVVNVFNPEEGKLCKLWNKAQQAQWACWRVQDVHIHMPNEGRAHPLAWAPSQDEGPDLPITFQETCSASKRGLSSKPQRLVQQVWVTSSASLWGLLCKERRQDLTTIKRPQHPQKRYA